MSPLLLQCGLSAAFESSGEAAAIADHAGIVQICNQAMEYLTGYSRSEITGKPLNIIEGAEDSDWIDEMRQSLRSGKSWSSEFLSRKKDGTSYAMEVQLTPFLFPFSNSGQPFGIIANYRPVIAVGRWQAHLSQPPNLEAMGRQALRMGHEVSNVISVVNVCSEWLLSRMEHDHPFYDRTNKIRQAGQRGAEMLHQLLTVGPVER